MTAMTQEGDRSNDDGCNDPDDGQSNGDKDDQDAMRMVSMDSR